MKRAVALLALINLCACGVKTSSNTGPIVTNQTLGGIFRGTMTTASGATVPGLVIVTDDGKFVSEAQNTATLCADVAQGELVAAGGSISGSSDIGIVDYTIDLGVQIDCGYGDGSVSGSATLSGTIAQQASMTLNSANTSALDIALPAGTATLTFDTLYNETSSLSKLAGNWTLATGAMLGIDANGVILSQNATNGCTLNGQVSIIDAAHNAYSVSVSYSNCGDTASALNGLTATGLMTLDDTVTPNALYAVYSVTLANGQVVVVPTYATN